MKHVLNHLETRAVTTFVYMNNFYRILYQVFSECENFVCYLLRYVKRISDTAKNTSMLILALVISLCLN